MEVVLENVRVPAANILLGEGHGFEIAQGCLGPGRIQHCMRSILAAEIAMIKVVAPNQSGKVVDRASQALGAASISRDFWLAKVCAYPRTVRRVDGAHEVHRSAISWHPA